MQIVRLLRFILISAVVLFATLTALSLLFPANLRISRSVSIGASREKVYKVVSDLHTWDSWNALIKGTPLTGRSFSSPSFGAGAFLRSDQLQITETAADSDGIKIDWRPTRGRRLESGFDLTQFPSDSLTIQWWFAFHFRWYPWEKLGSLVYDRQLGPMLEESLDSLKRFVENSP